MQILLAKGADIDAHEKKGYTALIWAALKGHTKAVQALLDVGADVNAQGTYDRMTALIWAAHEGHTEVVKALLPKGADIDAHEKKGYTALIFTAQEGPSERTPRQRGGCQCSSNGWIDSPGVGIKKWPH